MDLVKSQINFSFTVIPPNICFADNWILKAYQGEMLAISCVNPFSKQAVLTAFTIGQWSAENGDASLS